MRQVVLTCLYWRKRPRLLESERGGEWVRERGSETC